MVNWPSSKNRGDLFEKTCSNCGNYRYPEIKTGKVVPGRCRMTGKDEVRLQRTACVAWCQRNDCPESYLRR